jgi:hypothetical protein
VRFLRSDPVAEQRITSAASACGDESSEIKGSCVTIWTVCRKNSLNWVREFASSQQRTLREWNGEVKGWIHEWH